MRDLKSTTASRICYIYLRNWMLNFDRVTCNTTASNCGSLFGRFYGLVDSILIFKRKKKKEKKEKKLLGEVPFCVFLLMYYLDVGTGVHWMFDCPTSEIKPCLEFFRWIGMLESS